MIDPDGRDVWHTTDGDEIAGLMSALSREGGGALNRFQSGRDNKGQSRISDKEFCSYFDYDGSGGGRGGGSSSGGAGGSIGGRSTPSGLVTSGIKRINKLFAVIELITNDNSLTLKMALDMTAHIDVFLDPVVVTAKDGSANSSNFGYDDAVGIGMSFSGVVGDGIHNIMVDRGKYLARNASSITGKSYSIQKMGDIVIRSRIGNVITNAKYLNYARISGRALGVVGSAYGIVTAGVDIINNPTAGNCTKLAIRSFAVGAAFIPVVGWGVSLGIGMADAIWGDEFYDWIDK